ncbi:N-acetylmuramoyl-L-alanine amidase (modular protein) [Pseudorhizobium banfieldiae]|uniref:N-acetylmuramoyl-L-alanine amidase (Modular protein) n=1 Tax=Pseudorhizobium banfieldiae TaxID=1125847 RepID=L0NEG3_9HYPH|nr:peptidoglycan-binding protein [Pseudorhizobium banfieldiae]CAD6606304.1 N-acetylmuramoyl-L-alanine amidase [arsenite-oxidising bacterium NT-25]CCF19181.1 N-acetylmuramoyl-L-alanine amidase (modular protein) [Pseudorhizobium banfieldiae]
MATLLKLGSKGKAVEEVQTLLNKTPAKPKLTVDGDFGGKTDKAVRHFQEKSGLVVDGKVGPQTLAALKQTVAPLKPGRPEPAKGAIVSPVPETGPTSVSPAPPPNAKSVRILDTSRVIEEVIVHCTATPEGKDFTVDDVRAWHKQRGWSDIGYHFLVYRDGRVIAGRPIGQVGAHVSGRNTGTVGIAYIGGLAADGQKAKDTRTDAQRSSLLWLTMQLAAKFPVRKVSGHNEYASKACPSFDVRKDQLSTLAR